ncbi:MAG: GntR family transcriptional regulator [Bacteroidota bacterium]
MEFNSQKAIYMQIVDFMLENILTEKLKEGDRIQSIRELAAELQVNPRTVIRTYNYLNDFEIIFNKRGLGYFIAEDALLKARDLRRTTFMNEYIPELFKNMRLLKIDFEELYKIYNQNLINEGHEN